MIRTTVKTILTLAACCNLWMPMEAHAASEEPLEITADHSLEWDRAKKVFIAKTNALAVQGDVSISADTLEAHYREEKGSSMQLYKMLAKGNVEIKSKDSVAYGDNAEYSIVDEYAIMTGEELKMVSDDQTLTATENFEYWVTTGKLVANGDAKIVRPKANKKQKDMLEAKKISAFMKENKAGKRVLDKMTATGSVKITTPTEILTGRSGVYNAKRNIAEITGNVKIKRGPNELQGEKAQVDLNTNVSRMFGSKSSGQAIKRVRGVFYPGSTKSRKPKTKIEEPEQQSEETTTEEKPKEQIKLTPPKTGLRRIQAKRPGDVVPELSVLPDSVTLEEDTAEQKKPAEETKQPPIQLKPIPNTMAPRAVEIETPDLPTLTAPLTKPQGASQ